MDRIINSLLENDLYKFSMGQAIYHLFSDYNTTWSFKCRNEDVHFSKEMVAEIKRQIKEYCNLRFTEEELVYLHNIRWLKGNYVAFLKLWQPCFDDFIINDEAECGLKIETRGTWLNTTMYEVPTLAIVNEVYFRMKQPYEKLLADFKERCDQKCKDLLGGLAIGSFSEFGLRRRLSAEAQEYAIESLKKINGLCGNNNYFLGTSNVYLAKKFNLTPVGTMAHEWIMCVGQGDHKHNPAYSNYYALRSWVKEYGVQNGIALTDTITTDCFLRDFDLTNAVLFSGVRHDSGDPIVWGEKLLDHYRKLGVDAKNKTLLFSDSLDFVAANRIYRVFSDRCRVAFGIGTYISNDTYAGPLNIVMKVTRCNGMDVAKISDVDGKGMCNNEEYVNYLNRSIQWRMDNEDCSRR